MNQTMNASQSLSEVLRQSEFSPRGEKSDWLDAIHAKAFEVCKKFGVPNRREESWRCTDLDFLLKTPFAELSSPAAEALPVEVKKTLSAYGQSFQAVLVDGFFSKKDSRIPSLPDGMILMGLSDAVKGMPEKVRPYMESPDGHDFFSALNAAYFRDGAFLYVPAGLHVPKAIDFILVSTRTEQPAVCYPKLVIVAEKETTIRVRLTLAACTGSAGLTNAAIDLFAGENSEVRWINLQKETASARYLTSLKARLASRCRLEMLSFWGGEVHGRMDSQIHLCGDDAAYSLDGVAVLGGNARVSQAIGASHEASRGHGRQCYKNILTGKALAEFNSLVSVAAHTAGNDSGQLNRNLILSDEARAYSRPQLKIDADEVKATHGSATGRLRDSELFYLRSRGISPEDARRMLIRGFVQEILVKISDDDLRRDLQEWVNQYLKIIDNG